MGLAAIGAGVGFALVMGSQFALTTATAPYVALALLAGLDTLAGGGRAWLESRFDHHLFLSGFLITCSLAVLLAYLGDLLGLNLLVAAAVALVLRIFNQVEAMHHLWLARRRRILVKPEGDEE